VRVTGYRRRPTARFFMERMLPETAAQLARIQTGAASTMELPDEAF
jgi:3-(methylsulfanyl)propanoyl-CoA dehydrogenase